MRTIALIALTLTTLAACSSTGREINSLNAEERDLATQIRALEDARKANIALVSALQMKQREGSTSRAQADAKR